MYAPSPDTELHYSRAAPIIIVGSSDGAIDRARAGIIGHGRRVGAALHVSEAAARLRSQARASLVWVELDGGAPASAAAELFHMINTDVRDGRYNAVVSAPIELRDQLAALLDRGVRLIVDAGGPERGSALADALAGAEAQLELRDVASERGAERLRQLSDEVSRIASALARLSTDPRTVSPTPSQEGAAPPVSVSVVRSVIRARRLRSRFFGEELFADPAWDMMLDLLNAELSHVRVSVSSLCMAAAVPATTALRWMKMMVSQGLFVRNADPNDARRVFIELSPETSERLKRYFGEVGRVPVV